jgi:hypothetical protein
MRHNSARPIGRPVLTTAAMVVAAAGCRHPSPASTVAPEPVSISLERTPCYGNCPAYVVTLYGDGSVRFTGRDHSATQGDASGHVEPDSVRAINHDLDAFAFGSLADSLTFGSAACPQLIPDLPAAILTRTTGSAIKRVRHHPGCQGAPEALTVIEQRIDAVANTAQWTERR